MDEGHAGESALTAARTVTGRLAAWSSNGFLCGLFFVAPGSGLRWKLPSGTVMTRTVASLVREGESPSAAELDGRISWMEEFLRRTMERERLLLARRHAGACFGLGAAIVLAAAWLTLMAAAVKLDLPLAAMSVAAAGFGVAVAGNLAVGRKEDRLRAEAVLEPEVEALLPWNGARPAA